MSPLLLEAVLGKVVRSTALPSFEKVGASTKVGRLKQEGESTTSIGRLTHSDRWIGTEREGRDKVHFFEVEQWGREGVVRDRGLLSSTLWPSLLGGLKIIGGKGIKSRAK